MLICHAGEESICCLTHITLSKAWTSLPTRVAGEDAAVVANPTARLTASLSRLCRNAPRGSVVVAALDVLLDLGNSSNTVNGTRRVGACASLLVVCCSACRAVPSTSHPCVIPRPQHCAHRALLWMEDRCFSRTSSTTSLASCSYLS